MSDRPRRDPAPPAPDYITLNEAARRSPGKPHISSVWRWCRKGVKARDGSRVYLAHRRFGGKVFTTPQWLEDFAEELADRDREHFDAAADAAREAAPESLDATAPTPSKKPARRAAAQRERAIARATAELEAADI